MDFFIEVDKEAFFFVLTVLGQLWEPLGLLVDVVEFYLDGLSDRFPLKLAGLALSFFCPVMGYYFFIQEVVIALSDRSQSYKEEYGGY